ncbi:MAG: urease accessory protein [Robiginitomaculum sp.]|nr:MAG: urease accessory protein [Robiginitomaculum sp.]
MISILFFGFLLGMRHAVEADHIAAVASLTSKTTSARQGVRQGMAWGLGHTLTLFLFGSLVLFAVNIIPDKIVNSLELAVGIMLIILGIDVLRRLYKERVHFHAHTHGQANDNEKKHFHAHSHKGENKDAHNPAAHKHEHKQGFPIRALLVGLMHGMAGSAALIILTLQTMTSPWLGLIYIAIFGIGSIAGMGLFSLVIVIPLRAARHMTWLYNGLQASVGTATIALGAFTVLHTAHL